MAVVLVTGAAGFAGSHLLQHLAGSAELIGWSRSRPPAEVANLARWQRVDILDGNQVSHALREARPSSIFHCAGLPNVVESWTDTSATLAANVLGTHRLLQGVENLGLPCRILVTGSAQVYAPSSQPIGENDAIAPGSPYALSKLAQEELALRANGGLVEVVVTRAFNHTGPRQTPAFVAPSIARQIALIERAGGEPVIKIGNLDTQRDLLDVRDTVRAYAALMKSGTPGTVYNVASGVARPVRAVADALVSRARVPVTLEVDPSRVRATDIPVLIGNPYRLHEATGWLPEISFDQMIDDLLEYWRSYA